MPKASEGGGGGGESTTTQPSNNLWIGNLTIDTSDSDLLDLFGRYGVVDSVTNYATRNYAFIYYKRLDDARAAKDGLQNALLRGNSIRIEFARPAKPAKNLWVGGISLSVSKEQLEEEFSKIGKLENFKFLRDRNSALVEYYRLEDAATAVKTLNGRCIGGEPIRVDFLRSQPFRRDNRAESHDSRDVNLNNRGSGPPEPYWGPPEVEDFPEAPHFGPKRHPHSGGRREGQPSRILWVGYPQSVQIDEHMLHNAMILFGEIERIKSYPSKHYSFVEFRSVDEARRAKEGLQGRLFNDPRIHIMFSSSELAPPKDSPGFFTGVKGPRPDMFFNDPPFGPGPMDFFGPNHPMTPNNFPGPLAPNGMPGPHMLMRPFGPQGGFDQVLSSPEMLNELAGLLQNFQDGNPNNPMGPNWRRLSPAPGMNMIPSPAPGMRPYPPTRPLPGSWDGSDARAFEREPKRSRFDGPSPIDDMPFPVRMMDDQGIAGDKLLGFERPPFPVAQGQNRHSPLGMSVPSGEATGPLYPDGDFCWRGIIAKGGTPVCRARCVPLGNGLDSQMPDIVNCSARTGLDMLAKHYTEASGFDIVFFLPDSEDDFASYTEFLHYLGAKNRAGVAKFDDGTTLFLVPPSDFLTKVLNVSGPERLYGVVLKLPQQKSSSSVHQQQAISQSQVIDRHHLPPLQADFSHLPAKEDQDLQVDYSRLSQERTMSQLPKPPIPSTEEPSSTQSVPPDYASNSTSILQSGLSLTPELLATLASLLPSGSQPSSSTTVQLPSGSLALAPTLLPVSVNPDKPTLSEGWRQGHISNFQSTPNHMEEQKVNPAHQMGYQVNSQAPYMTQFPGYLSIPNGPDNSGQGILRNSQVQDPSQNFPQQGVASRPANNFGTPSQGGQFNVSQQANQPFQLDASLNPQMSYGAGNTTDAIGYNQSPAFQQTRPSNIPPTQVQRMNSSQQLGMPPVNNNVNMVVPDQVQQLQSALSGVGQGTADGEADKNQRYQSTLKFAASLLLQIQQQQQQQQGNSQAANGTGNHQ